MILAEAEAPARSSRPSAGPDVWTVRAAGRTLSAPWSLSGVWHRPPYCVPLVLTRIRGGQAPETVGVAWIGTTGSLRALRDKAEATGRLLLEQAVNGRSPGMPDDEGASNVTVPDGPMAFLGGWLRWQAARWHARLFAEWWTVGVCDEPASAILERGRLGPVAWMRPRVTAANAYWADPFPWPGTPDVLAEECSRDGGPGAIVVLRQGRDGVWARDRVLLGGSMHRSYPFTYLQDGAVYLLPECLEVGRVVLSRLLESGRIEAVATIAAAPLADPTLFRHDGTYWVAGTDPAVGDHDALCLFHAERLEGPWRPHRGNPVKIDIRATRPAGTPFWHGGALFRPAQDCAGRYGAAIVINQILALTPERFSERAVLRLAPDPHGPMRHGLHTLSVAGAGDEPRVFVDGKRMVPVPLRAVRRLVRRLPHAMRRARR